ncbi:MAG: 5-bromo-4-chloroindolyl phosphate hydrolysis family protein [Spirochaetes bacterium]|nr:5-bromo-4-chloroindolyl phosphate hydrolysis family protein [Spirochaetota bacterium]
MFDRFKISAKGTIYAALIGGIIFIVMLLFIKMGLLLSIILAVVGYIAGLLLFSQKKGSDYDEYVVQQVIDYSAECKKKITSLSSMIYHVKQPGVKQDLTTIKNIATDILNDLKTDPSDLEKVQTYLTYYLDATLNMASKYITLAEGRGRSSKIDETLVKVEKMLSEIKSVFSQQHENLYKEEMVQLNSQIKVIEDLMRLDQFNVRDDQRSYDESQE